MTTPTPTQEQATEFLKEYKELCLKHGITIGWLFPLACATVGQQTEHTPTNQTHSMSTKVQKTTTTLIIQRLDAHSDWLNTLTSRLDNLTTLTSRLDNLTEQLIQIKSLLWKLEERVHQLENTMLRVDE